MFILSVNNINYSWLASFLTFPVSHIINGTGAIVVNGDRKSEKVAELAQKLDRLQPFIAVLP